MLLLAGFSARNQINKQNANESKVEIDIYLFDISLYFCN